MQTKAQIEAEAAEAEANRLALWRNVKLQINGYANPQADNVEGARLRMTLNDSQGDLGGKKIQKVELVAIV